MAKGPKEMRKRVPLYAEFVALGLSITETEKPPQTYREAIALALYKRTDNRTGARWWVH
jgi:hypothetical protein